MGQPLEPVSHPFLFTLFSKFYVYIRCNAITPYLFLVESLAGMAAYFCAGVISDRSMSSWRRRKYILVKSLPISFSPFTIDHNFFSTFNCKSIHMRLIDRLYRSTFVCSRFLFPPKRPTLCSIFDNDNWDAGWVEFCRYYSRSLAFLPYSFSMFAAGSFSGLIPDNVDKSQLGFASGYDRGQNKRSEIEFQVIIFYSVTGCAKALGEFAGLVIAAICIWHTFDTWLIYVSLAGLFVITAIPTLSFRERPRYYPKLHSLSP